MTMELIKERIKSCASRIKSWLEKFRMQDKTENPQRFKKFIPAIMIAAILIAGAATLIFVLQGQGRDIFTTAQIQVYFFSPSEGQLVPEGRPIPHGYQEDWVAAAIGHLRFPPNSNRLNSTWPNINPLIGVEETPFLLNFYIHEGALTAEFYDSYLEMPALQEALFRSALTLTMVNLGFIDEVIFRVNDRQWTETAETIANGPAISPSHHINTQLALYFIDESGEGLVREYYSAIGMDTQRPVQTALERLIEGAQTEGAFSAIPSETRVLGVIPDEPLSIYINLSGDFLRISGGPAQTQLMIAAIVNTVLANTPPNIRQVFFLVDSSRQQLPGIEDFTIGFEYDETVMMDYVPDYSYSYEETGSGGELG